MSSAVLCEFLNEGSRGREEERTLLSRGDDDDPDSSLSLAKAKKTKPSACSSRPEREAHCSFRPSELSRKTLSYLSTRKERDEKQQENDFERGAQSEENQVEERGK